MANATALAEREPGPAPVRPYDVPCTSKLASHSSVGMENDVVERVGAATATLIKERQPHLLLRELIRFPFWGKKATVSAEKFTFVGVFIHFYRLFVTTKHLCSLLH